LDVQPRQPLLQCQVRRLTRCQGVVPDVKRLLDHVDAADVHSPAALEADPMLVHDQGDAEVNQVFDRH
jgi:hypothetical protein